LCSAPRACRFPPWPSRTKSGASVSIEQPTKLHLAINRKTAEALGITVSKEMLFRADELID